MASTARATRTTAHPRRSASAPTRSYAGGTQDQVLSDGTATGITYGLAGQDGQPWVQSWKSVLTGNTVYVIRDQSGIPLGLDTGGTDYAFVTDNLGSVTTVVSNTGTTAATYVYGPYGNVITRTGYPMGAENLIGYTGALTDLNTTVTGIASTSYVHLGNRWYNPATGSFTTQDTNNYLPDPANGNHYAYAADNPANYTDPTGRSCGGLLDYAGIGGFLTGSGEAAVAIADAGAVATLAVGGFWAEFSESDLS